MAGTHPLNMKPRYLHNNYDFLPLLVLGMQCTSRVDPGGPWHIHSYLPIFPLYVFDFFLQHNRDSSNEPLLPVKKLFSVPASQARHVFAGIINLTACDI